LRCFVFFFRRFAWAEAFSLAKAFRVPVERIKNMKKFPERRTTTSDDMKKIKFLMTKSERNKATQNVRR
jgi:hypothetical protein